MSTSGFGKSIVVLDSSPMEHKLSAYNSLRDSMGCELIKVLCQSEIPAVVDIKEKQAPVNKYGLRATETTIAINITPVEHKHIVMPTFEQIEYAAYSKRPLLQRIKAALRIVRG